jgi:hypothetical protein
MMANNTSGMSTLPIFSRCGSLENDEIWLMWSAGPSPELKLDLRRSRASCDARYLGPELIRVRTLRCGDAAPRI